MHTPQSDALRRTAAPSLGRPAAEPHRGAGNAQERCGPEGAAIAALIAENAVLARALADAQQRFTRYRSAQRSLLDELQSALLRAHGEAVLARSRATWLGDDGVDDEPALSTAAVVICRTSAAAWRLHAARARSDRRLVLLELPVNEPPRGTGAGRTGAP